jgi:hypothetical protein
LAQAGLDLFTSQFAEGIKGDPAGGLVIKSEKVTGEGDSIPIEGETALADAAQGPVDGFPDKVARVSCMGFDERECFYEPRVGGRLIMHGKAGDEDIARTADEFRLFGRPQGNLIPGKGCPDIEVVAAGVADIPGIEIRGPGVHQLGCCTRVVSEQGGEDARIGDGSFPELESEIVVCPDLLSKSAQFGDSDSQAFFRVDAEAGPIPGSEPGSERDWS